MLNIATGNETNKRKVLPWSPNTNDINTKLEVQSLEIAHVDMLRDT